MTVHEAIEEAERILPGAGVADQELDPRWQAIIQVGEFISTNPEDVWAFVRKWGDHTNADLRMAIATCLLEHLLEEHFEIIFPQVEKEARRSKRFAKTFLSCWAFGKSCEPRNRGRIERLEQELKAS